MTIKDRETGWLNEAWFETVTTELTRLCFRYEMAVPVWVAMPDHLHLLVAGASMESDQRRFVRAARRMLNGSFGRVDTRLQKQAYDHVLRPSERGRQAFARVVFYILNNPVRQQLVVEAKDWPFAGSIVPGEVKILPLKSDFTERWWGWWNAKVGDR